jgi:AcrR family transcriptional regulator
LLAAIQILSEEGIQALTQTRVAAMAGLRQSHLTYYFATRSDLVHTAVETTALGLLEELTVERTGQPNTLPQFRKRLVRLVSNPRISRRLIAILAATDEDHSLVAVLDNLKSRVCARWQESLQHLGLKVTELDVMLLQASLVGISVCSAHRSSVQAQRHIRATVEETFDRMLKISISTARQIKKSKSHHAGEVR